MSTQILTELPNIQKAGMDFNNVLNEMKNIISNNPNWKDNWNEFLEGEAGTMMIEMMAWLSDNLSTRQDVLHNEMFLATAQKDANKIKLLKQIGYIPGMAHASKVPIDISFSSILNNDIYIQPPVGNNSLAMRTNKIVSFKGKDINGKSINWEIMHLENGKPDYLYDMKIDAGNNYYTKNNKSEDIYAIEGMTKYEEFTTSTSDGPYFNLNTTNMAAESLRVYIKDTRKECMQVNSFLSTKIFTKEKEYDSLAKSDPIPFILEMNVNKTYKIRFASADVLDTNLLLPAGTTISVFYRECSGTKGNIKPGFINTTIKIEDSMTEVHNATIKNKFPAFGGTDKETLDKAVLNGPLSVRTMDRAVTPEDYNIILKNHPLIFKSKTYTASNQPNGFINYYGRYINPQESFTFLMLNKNYDGVPSSNYNYFPWFDGNYEPRLNEKYMFGTGKFNNIVSVSDTKYDVNLMSSTSSGSNHYFRNCTILNLGPDWTNKLFNKDGSENEIAVCKITKEKSKERFYNKIPFGLISNYSFYSIGMGKNNRQSLTEYTNAKFISKMLDNSIPVNIIGSEKLSFVMNDFFQIEIDLSSGLVTENKNSMFLKWDNNFSGIPDETSEDPDASESRPGILQIIRKSMSNAAVVSDGSSTSYATIDINGRSLQRYGLDLRADSSININENTGVCLDLGDYRVLFNIDEEIKDYNKLCEKISDILYHGIEGVFLKKRDTEENYVPVGEASDIRKYEVGMMKRTAFRTDNDGSTKSNYCWDSYDMVFYNIKKDDNSILKDVVIGSGDEKYVFSNSIYVCDPDVNDNFISYNGKNYYTLGFLLSSSSKTRNIIPHPVSASDYKNADLINFKYIKNNEGKDTTKGYLEITAPSRGNSSSIYFRKTGAKDFSYNKLNVPYEEGSENSIKSYGIKKVYLVKENISNSAKEVKTSIGDIIFENNCIFNDGDFSNLYAHFKTSINNSIRLGTSKNFYNYDDSKKPAEDISGILGEYVNKKKDVIDSISDYDVRLTKEPVDTNSLFYINSDLDVIKSDRVELTTEVINNFTGVINMSIDNYKIDMDLKDSSYSDIVETAREAIKNGDIVDDESGYQEDVNDIINSIIREDILKEGSISISSYNKNNGSIKFYNNDNSESINKIYKSFLGTNKTNPGLYDLYPRDMFESENIVEENGEYYYVPTKENPLNFTYRKMVYDNESKRYISRVHDYCIKSEKIAGKQSYFLEKNENGFFPDTEFFVHYINDKSKIYNKNSDKENDETIIQRYMESRRISGTDMTFMQPYFKTYDIRANIKYNSNYNESDISSKVKEAIDNVCDLKYSEIAGSMSRAKIFKAIMNCVGVEDCSIYYFGPDYIDRSDENTEEMYSDFYEILCLHDDIKDEHGKILTFERVY